MIRDDLKLLHNDSSSICLPKQEPIDENNSDKHPGGGGAGGSFPEQRLFGLNSANQFHSSFNVNSLSQIANNNVNPMRFSDSYDYLRIKMSPDSHNQNNLPLDSALRNGLQFSLDNNQLDLINSHDNQSGGVVRTRRRKAGINDEDRVCVVCGEPASGYNFDRLTCESCKAFFRRNALKPRDKIKKCNRHGQCNIEGSQRKHCPSCRLEKCLAAGMKKELILPPEKLEQRAKPRRRKNQSVNDDGSVSSPGGMGGSTSGNGTICLENGSNSGYVGNGSNSGRFSPLQVNSPYNSGSGNVSHLMMSQTNNLTLAVAAVAAMNQQRMTNSGNNSNPVMMFQNCVNSFNQNNPNNSVNNNNNSLQDTGGGGGDKGLLRNHYPVSSSSSPSLFNPNGQRYPGNMGPNYLPHHRNANNSGSESPNNTSANENNPANLLSAYRCNNPNAQQSLSTMEMPEISKSHGSFPPPSSTHSMSQALQSSSEFFPHNQNNLLMNQSRNFTNHTTTSSSSPSTTPSSMSQAMNNKMPKSHLLHNSSRYVPFRPGFAPIPQNSSHDQDYSKEFYPLDNRVISGLSKKYLCIRNFIKDDVEAPNSDSRVSDSKQSVKDKESLSTDSNGQITCRHFACRRWCLRRARLAKINSNEASLIKVKDHSKVQPDSRLLGALSECVQRIREPFTPAEHLETKVAETLEQEYNRMDACIRRIIKVVKLLPFFNDIGRPAQLGLLRANIYGLIVLYSSFFFERNIRKLRYPVLQTDGNLSFVTVSMMDDVASKNSSSPPSADCVKGKPPSATKINSNSSKTSNLRADFELYKANTLSAFDLLDKLTGSDDTLRVALLAVKLFSDDTLPSEYRHAVSQARRSYLLFLWTYLRWNSPGPMHLINQRFCCLLLSFVDLRTLESRMTDFAKLLSLDGLSPLMREVCSQKMMGGAQRTQHSHHHTFQQPNQPPHQQQEQKDFPPPNSSQNAPPPLIKQEATAESTLMH